MFYLYVLDQSGCDRAWLYYSLEEAKEAFAQMCERFPGAEIILETDSDDGHLVVDHTVIAYN